MLYLFCQSISHAFFFFLIILLISGCAESSLLYRLFSTCDEQGLLTLSCNVRASLWGGFSCCGARALAHSGFSSCSMRDLPWSGMEPVSPALAGGFFSSEPPEKLKELFFSFSQPTPMPNSYQPASPSRSYSPSPSQLHKTPSFRWGFPKYFFLH